MKSTEKLIKERIKALEEENKQLKDRINKATELLKLYRNSEANWIEFTIDDKLYMIEILKGE